MPGEDKTYTQAELDVQVEDRNKALEANKNEILAELAEARKRLKALDGIDPQAVKTMQAKLTELEHERKAKSAGLTSEELNRLRQEVRDDLEGEYSTFKQSAEQLGKEIRELRLDSVVKNVMGKQGVRGERVNALFRLTADQFDLTDDGQPMVRDRKGTPVDKYVAEVLSKEYPEFFTGTGSSGGGASKSAQSASGGSHVIPAGDNSAFLANLEGIAKGTVEVR